jgi:MFS family permease
VVVVALAVRLIYLDHAPYVDELNHALAARSLLDEGSLRINGGAHYTRAWVLTVLVAGLYATLGDSLVVGRLPAVVAGTLLVAGVYVWTRRHAGVVAACTAGALVCFAPVSIYLSQQVRFYSLQALLFWAGAVGVYALVSHPPRTRARAALLLAGVSVAFVLALHLQPITAVGIAAVGAWAAIVSAPGVWRTSRQWAPSTRLGVAVATLAAVVAVVLLFGDAFRRAFRVFGYADLWAAHAASDVRFYHALFTQQFPTIWTLFPVLLLLAASRFPRPTGFLATVFLGALAFHSAAAWKHERYIFYALPFLFAIVGLAVAVALPWLRTLFDRTVTRATGARRTPRPAGALFAALAGFALLFAASGNAAVSYSYRMLTVPDERWRMEIRYRGEADWSRVADELRASAAGGELLVSSSTLKALYYIGRVDVGISVTELARTRGRTEFSVASKEAVPLIGRPESLDLLRACFPAGLVVVEETNWRHDWGVPDDVADWIETHLEPVRIDPASRVAAFRWSTAAPASTPACEAIPVARR